MINTDELEKLDGFDCSFDVDMDLRPFTDYFHLPLQFSLISPLTRFNEAEFAKTKVLSIPVPVMNAKKNAELLLILKPNQQGNLID